MLSPESAQCQFFSFAFILELENFVPMHKMPVVSQLWIVSQLDGATKNLTTHKDTGITSQTTSDTSEESLSSI